MPDLRLFDTVEMTFAPSRLTTARLCRGLTMKAVADSIRVSPRTITAYEDGSTTPPETCVQLISKLLNFPFSFFYGAEVEDIPHKVISFRARRSLTARIRDLTLGRSRLATNFISPAFQAKFTLPTCDLVASPELRTDPETAARQLRDHWKLGHGPIANMVHLLEAKGIEVYWLNVESPCVDAVSYSRDSKPYVFLNLAKEAGERGRFDAAHELGHLVLHPYLHLLLTEDDALEPHEIEMQADAFASAFLMPREQFMNEIPRNPTLDNFMPLKKRWGVSLQAAVVRAYHLKKITRWQYESTFKEISRRGWKKSEPNSFPREQSRIHELIYSRLASRGVKPFDFARSIDL